MAVGDITIRGLTAAAMDGIRNAIIVGAEIRNDRLYFRKYDGGELDAGIVGGQPGPAGSIESSPAGGDLAGTYPNPTLKDQIITSAKMAFGQLTHLHVNSANRDGAVGTPSMRTIGTGALQAAAGNHSHYIPKIRSGLLSHTASAVNTVTNVAYPNLWTAGYFGSGVIPHVIICPDSTVPQNIPYYSVNTITDNGFSVAASRTTNTFTYYRWIAVQPN